MAFNNIFLKNDYNRFKVLLEYDLTKTFSENNSNIFEQETSYTQYLDKVFSKPETTQKFHDENQKMIPNVYNWFKSLNSHDWLALVSITSGILGIIPTPLSPLLLALSTAAGVADAVVYFNEGDKYMGTMMAALTLIPGGEFTKIFKNSKKITKYGVKGITELIKKAKNKQLNKIEIVDFNQIVKEFTNEIPTIKQTLTNTLKQTLITSLKNKSPKYVINLLLILQKIGILKLSELSLKIGSVVYTFDKLYLFVFRDLIPNKKDLDNRTKNELRYLINNLLGYENQVNEFLKSKAEEGLTKYIESGKDPVKITVTETPDQFFNNILDKNKTTPKEKKITPSLNDVLKNNKVIKLGDRGNSITELQNLLSNDYKFILTDFGNYENWNDGIFGKNTKLAVEKFQLDNNLDVTGVVNKQTLYRLIDIYKNKNI
jgi:hypothetical protein